MTLTGFISGEDRLARLARSAVETIAMALSVETGLEPRLVTLDRSQGTVTFDIEASSLDKSTNHHDGFLVTITQQDRSNF